MRSARAVAAALVVSAVVACGGTEGGTPTPADPPPGPTGGSTSSRPATSTTADTGDDALAGLDPCALLTPEDLTQGGFSGTARRDDLLDLLRCVWVAPGKSARVLLAPNTAMEDTNNGSATKVEDVTIGSHAGRLVQEAGGQGSCEYDLVVSDSSHATVAVLITGAASDTAQACAAAQQLVTIVEPKLP